MVITPFCDPSTDEYPEGAIDFKLPETVLPDTETGPKV